LSAYALKVIGVRSRYVPSSSFFTVLVRYWLASFFRANVFVFTLPSTRQAAS
jgi:hypothetical protein